MSQKSKKREAAKAEAKSAQRRAIEQQYSKGTENRRGLRLGQLEPLPLNHIGKFSFLSSRKRERYLNSIRRKAEVIPPEQ